MTQLADFQPTGAKTHLPMSLWSLENEVISSAASHPFHPSFSYLVVKQKLLVIAKQ